MHLSAVSLALLEALTLSGCVNSQLGWLKQQLQQQGVALSQQQQEQYGAEVDVGGLQRFVNQCVRAGALQTLCPVKLVEGSAVGRVQGVVLPSLLQTYNAQCGTLVGLWGQVLMCEPRRPLEVLHRLQQLLGHM
jgi:hypothetical protein